ncbi:MAG TPA: hypothetical protein VL588_02180 [Bdellovibrionota bacterium]|jgi:hypothetical protein|nr:hypothetical protein [Bdellovibrionota bacterium]
MFAPKTFIRASLLSLALAVMASIQVQAWGGGTPHGTIAGPVVNPLTGTSTLSVGTSLSADAQDPAAIKGTIGIVCVRNTGEVVAWYPSAADAVAKAVALRSCFGEVAGNWDHLGSVGTHADAGEPVDAITAYEGMVDLMDGVQRIAP